MAIEKGGNGQDKTPKEQQAAGQADKLPTLNPIWDRVSQVLAEQRATEQLKRATERLNRPPLGKDHVSPRREDKRRWRKKYPEKHRQNVAKWGRSEKGKAYNAAWMKEYRKRKKEAKSQGGETNIPKPSA
jgi:hypothetical protein